MTAHTLLDQIVELLAKHASVAAWWTSSGIWMRCTCGHIVRVVNAGSLIAPSDDDHADHRAHVSAVLSDLVAEAQKEAWDQGHEDGCIAAHCYTQRGMSYFDESKLTDCHTRNPYDREGAQTDAH